MRAVLPRIKIDVRVWAIALLIIPSFTLAIGLRWQLIGMILSVYRTFTVAVLIFIFATNKSVQRKLNNKICVTLLLLYVTIITCTAISQPQNMQYSIQLVIYGVVPFITVFLFSESVSRIVICKGISLALNILVVVNLIIMIVFPGGIYSTSSSNTITAYYLFGSKNQMVAPVLTCLFFEVEKTLGAKFRVSNIIICFICIAELLLGGSGTGLVMLFIFAVFTILQITNHSVSLMTSLLIVVVSYIGLVILRIQDLFSFLIVNILHKSLSLSDRTVIWDFAIDSIRNNPIIGTGPTESLAANVHLELDYGDRDMFAHNLLLDYILMGGVLAGFLFILMIYFTYQQHLRFVFLNHKPSFIWWGIITYLLASIVDVYQGHFCLFLMISYLISLNNSSYKSSKSKNGVLHV